MQEDGAGETQTNLKPSGTIGQSQSEFGFGVIKKRIQAILVSGRIGWIANLD